MHFSLVLSLLFSLVIRDQPFPPAWSPDHQILAKTMVGQAFVTPEGGAFRLLLNGRVVYPTQAKHSWFSGYHNVHTFLSNLAWSPDSQRVAFVEKIYDWEYTDPFNYDFEGSVSALRFFLVLVSREGRATGYRLERISQDIQPVWQGPDKIVLKQRSFDLQADPPPPVP